jgi:DNA (cytosine-5)-methyltransferase 1
MTKSSFIGIDLFAGAGGLSLGLTNAGFDMKLGIEVEKNITSTLQKNNPDQKVITEDIRNLNPLTVLKKNGLRPTEIDLIAGGPPCQGFSKSNKRSRYVGNPLNDMYLEYFKFVGAIKPEIFLFENVAGLTFLPYGERFQEILKLGKKLNYKIQTNIVDSQNYGVPQQRKRVFIIGTKRKTENILTCEKKSLITVKNAINDLPIVENGNNIDELPYQKNDGLSKYQKKMRENNGKTVKNNIVTKNSDLILERYKHIPEGGNWKNIPLYLMKNYNNPQNCHGWIYYRLKWDSPSVVISNFRKNMLIHPGWDRGLTVREAARLQSFPDNYIFCGTKVSQQQQVANAVPPLMAEEIGKKLINGFFYDR